MSGSVEASRQALANGSKTFHWASRLLPSEVRDDAASLYAFCRYVDDEADDATDLVKARASLERVMEELEGRSPPRPIVGVLREVAKRRDMDILAARHLVATVRSDLEPVRIGDVSELLRYCYGAAGTVGLMMCGVLGVRDRSAHPHAVDLGMAMQLTNICRDVAEDAARGRVYLPASLLRAQGVEPEALIAGHENPLAVRRVIAALLAMAESLYARAERGMGAIPAIPRLAILVAAHTYRAIGRRLLARGIRYREGRTVVGAMGKAIATLGALLRYPFLTRPQVPRMEVAR